MALIAVTQPKYVTVVNTMQRRITDGIYPAGSAIPSESRLCAEFGASRPTIVRALGILQQDGWLDSEQGKGRFVRPGKVNPLKTMTAPVTYEITGHTPMNDPVIVVTAAEAHPLAGFRLLLRSTASMDHAQEAPADGVVTYLVYDYPEPENSTGTVHGAVRDSTLDGAVAQVADYMTKIWIRDQAADNGAFYGMRSALALFFEVLNGEAPADTLQARWQGVRDSFARAQLAMNEISKL